MKNIYNGRFEIDFEQDLSDPRMVTRLYVSLGSLQKLELGEDLQLKLENTGVKYINFEDLLELTKFQVYLKDQGLKTHREISELHNQEQSMLGMDFLVVYKMNIWELARKVFDGNYPGNATSLSISQKSIIIKSTKIPNGTTAEIYRIDNGYKLRLVNSHSCDSEGLIKYSEFLDGVNALYKEYYERIGRSLISLKEGDN